MISYQSSRAFWGTGILFLALLMVACNPKASQALQEEREQAVEKDTATQVVEESNLSECVKFSDIKQSEKALESYVIYRDFFKLNQYQQALPYWRQVYSLAPAADGKRYVVYTDGVYLYEDLMRKSDDQILTYNYMDTILYLYDEAIECYPNYDGYLTARKAFDIYYKFPDSHTEEQKYSLFTHAITLLGDDTPAFVVNPFTALLVQQFGSGAIDTVETRQWATKIKKLVEEQVKLNPNAEDWKIVERYALDKIADFESVKGFYDCAYYRDLYLSAYLESDTMDCDQAFLTYSKLRWGGCSEEDPDLQAIEEQLKNNCNIVPGGSSGLAKDAFALLQEGNYSKAIEAFDEAIKFAETDERKAAYALMVAKVYFSYLKNFPKSRTYALKAADYRSDWGEPYILIGKLYASSGPLCGPGTGWDSQIVTWPAIDKWTYAKKIDPEVADEAQALINEYWQYMPTNEDISKRLYKEGQSFRVKCWIQETTTIRASRKY